MSQTRVFRNDGQQMFTDEPAHLDYIDPGIVLLYADTERQVVCSYLEGHLNQPIQATIEHTFEGQIDLSDFENVVKRVPIQHFHLSKASKTNLESPRWAFDGLSEKPLAIGDLQLSVIRRLLDSSSTRVTGNFSLFSRDTSGVSLGSSDGGKTRLDFSVEHAYNGARFFKFLVRELADMDLTIAVSRSGRIEDLEDTDIVIHIDADYLDPDERVVPIGQTKELIANQKDSVQREEIQAKLQGPVEGLCNVFSREIIGGNGISDDVAEQVLREELNDGIEEMTHLKVVNSRRNWFRIGLGSMFGLLVGVFASGLVNDLADEAINWAYSTLPAIFQQTRLVVLESWITTGYELYIGITVSSFFILLGALLFRKRYISQIEDDLAPTSVWSDVVSLSIHLVTVISGVALLVSGILLWFQL